MNIPFYQLADALGVKPSEVYRSRDVLAVFENESQIREMTPDFAALEKIRDVFAGCHGRGGRIIRPG